MKIKYAGQTHVGMKRPHNEDTMLTLGEYNLYIVADGMGGHASGEVASQIAAETMANFIEDTSANQETTWPFREDRAVAYDENRIITAIKLANRRVYETAQTDARYRGMGTTVVCLLVGETGSFIAHVGDSRAYRLREKQLLQITEDHSFLNDYLKAHQLTQNEIENFPHKNVIVRALGMKQGVAVDVQRLAPQTQDRYLLCSDGLSTMVDDATIEAALNKTANLPLENACAELIAQANSAGGQDNISVVLVEFSA